MPDLLTISAVPDDSPDTYHLPSLALGTPTVFWSELKRVLDESSHEIVRFRCADDVDHPDRRPIQMDAARVRGASMLSRVAWWFDAPSDEIYVTDRVRLGVVGLNSGAIDTLYIRASMLRDVVSRVARLPAGHTSPAALVTRGLRPSERVLSPIGYAVPALPYVVVSDGPWLYRRVPDDCEYYASLWSYARSSPAAWTDQEVRGNRYLLTSRLPPDVLGAGRPIRFSSREGVVFTLGDS